MVLIPTLLMTGMLGLVPASDPTPAADQTAVFVVRQTATLGPIDEHAHAIRWWVSIPGDTRGQEILDMSVVEAPGPWKVVHEPDQGNHFLYVEAKDPGKDTLQVVVDFSLRRSAVHVDVDPAQVGSLSPAQQKLFAEELRLDAPHMEVTPEMLTMARDACAGTDNLALKARRLLQYVADVADHYSKDPSKPSCGVGDASNCLTQGGGCCTDLHSLFIALARSQGIPARLEMGYRLLGKNVGKEVDPGYRCWVEYFMPGYGWVPSDIVEADAATGLGAYWFSGLTEERLWLNQGRDFHLDSAPGADHVNHMSIGHALVDGVPARLLPDGDLPPQLTRKVHFDRRNAAAVAPLSAAVGN